MVVNEWKRSEELYEKNWFSWWNGAGIYAYVL